MVTRVSQGLFVVAKIRTAPVKKAEKTSNNKEKTDKYSFVVEGIKIQFY